jgi:hypothetical protein
VPTLPHMLGLRGTLEGRRNSCRGNVYLRQLTLAVWATITVRSLPATTIQARTYYSTNDRASDAHCPSDKVDVSHFSPNNSLWRKPVEATRSTSVRSRKPKAP